MAPPDFIDVSHWNGPINWPKTHAAGVRQAYIKATESINFRDPRFQANWVNAKAASVRRGAYHFFRGDKLGAAQATYFSAFVGVDRGELPPAVDVEAGAAGVSRATYTTRLRECLLEVARLFGRVPVIYTSAGAWGALTTNPAWVSEYALWLAAPDVSVPPLPMGATTWWLHQYDWHGRIDGIDGDVDLNRENIATTPPDPVYPDGTAAILEELSKIESGTAAIRGLVG